MFPEPERLGVKICGVTQARQGEEIAEMGADALGINFWSKSKRYLDPEVGAGWLPELGRRVTLVGVTVNASGELLDLLLGEGLVAILQLHGDEAPAEVGRLLDRGVQVIKALQVRDRDSLRQIGEYPCRVILLDAYNPGEYGGTGHSFPWELAAIAREEFPEKEIVLSGGLTPENVEQAVRRARPAAVDVASGVESAPGFKDVALVRRFIERARSAS